MGGTRTQWWKTGCLMVNPDTVWSPTVIDRLPAGLDAGMGSPINGGWIRIERADKMDGGWCA